MYNNTEEKPQRLCWCGESQFAAFSPDYLYCVACGTLVSQVGLSIEQLTVHDDKQDFYGREYWFAHQEQDLGFKNIMTRARLDLPERCMHWLRTLLKYKLPPGKTLELGSAHGGFVALLHQVGFDATGLELSSWVVDFAHETFDVPMLLGPVEDQQIEAGTLDVIALMDVLEHLPDPVATMRHCLSLLKPDGMLLIQTPCYPGVKPYDEMLATNDPFLEQFKSNEHLYLFSRPSIRKLFHDLKAEHLVFEPAMFELYDMFVVVSREPLMTHSKDEIEKVLAATRDGRMTQSMLDLDSQLRDLKQHYADIEVDRSKRLNIIHRLSNELSAVKADHEVRLTVINQLTAQLATVEVDRANRLDVIERLAAQLATVEADCTDRLDVIKRLDTDLADRANVIERLNTQLTDSNTEKVAQQNIIHAQNRILRRLPVRLLRKLRVV